jgi:hypothetical protein
LFHVQGLSANTTYHFRVVAHNVVKGKVEITEGKERMFSTQGAGGEFTLPDGRAWELVSPPDKHGGVLSKLSELGVIQAAVDGSAISYEANAPTEALPQGDAGTVQVLSTRTSTGWVSRDIATPHEAATGDRAGTAPEYRFFSEDLSTSVVQPFGLFNPVLSQTASEQTPYLHRLAGCTSSCFAPIVTGKAPFANVPVGTHFGEELECEENNGVIGIAKTVCGPQFQGATPDASHVVLRSGAPLVAGVPRDELYEWSAGKLALVSVLPQTKEQEEKKEELPAPTGATLLQQPMLGNLFGEPSGTARGAISADGNRVLWDSSEKLYLRDATIGKSLQIDARHAKAKGGQGTFRSQAVMARASTSRMNGG